RRRQPAPQAPHRKGGFSGGHRAAASRVDAVDRGTEVELHAVDGWLERACEERNRRRGGITSLGDLDDRTRAPYPPREPEAIGDGAAGDRAEARDPTCATCETRTNRLEIRIAHSGPPVTHVNDHGAVDVGGEYIGRAFQRGAEIACATGAQRSKSVA